VETKKRHLPILKDVGQPGDDGDPVRAPWQWVSFGALAVFVVWLPLAALTTGALAATGALAQAPTARAALFGAGLVVASLAGGFLVGRWGTRTVGVREAALSGLVAALAAAALAWSATGAAGGAVTIAIAVPSATLGGRWGVKWRTPA
jgi:hypothetical protein